MKDVKQPVKSLKIAVGLYKKLISEAINNNKPPINKYIFFLDLKN